MLTPFSGTRAKIGALASVAALAGGLLLTAMPAAQATQEFPPNPSATATAVCAGGPHFDVHLANIGGLSIASFTITITTAGTPPVVEVKQQDVETDGTFDVSYPMQEDVGASLTISSVGMTDVFSEGTFDCQAPITTTTVPDPVTTTTAAPAVQAVAVATVAHFTG